MRRPRRVFLSLLSSYIILYCHGRRRTRQPPHSRYSVKWRARANTPPPSADNCVVNASPFPIKRLIIVLRPRLASWPPDRHDPYPPRRLIMLLRVIGMSRDREIVNPGGFVVQETPGRCSIWVLPSAVLHCTGLPTHLPLRCLLRAYNTCTRRRAFV